MDLHREQTGLFLLSIFLSISISTSLRFQTFSKPAHHSKSKADNYNNNLSLELMHREDFLPADLTPETRLNIRLQRDHLRVQSLSTYAAVTQSDYTFSSSPVISGLSDGSGEYFALVGVGNPPHQSYMTLDTGSDVGWIQCLPCDSCYYQPDPIFNPNNSRSFFKVLFNSSLCQQVDDHNFDAQGNCIYGVSYGDGSFSRGDLSTEALNFAGMTVSNFTLGCGHDNGGIFNWSSGLLGLGRGELSFPVQTASQFGGKFSYCLVDRNSSSSSTILFGQSAVSQNAVFTPILGEKFYYVNLTGISVGDGLVAGINSSVFGGGVIIDSGTAITHLAEPAYGAMRDAFRAGVSGLNPASGFGSLDTCYAPPVAEGNVTVPTVALHFDGGAEMRLVAENYLVQVDGKLCLAFVSTYAGLSIIGNVQQQGFRVMYDLAASRVGFIPGSC